MARAIEWVDLPARLLMASLFLVSGAKKLATVAQTQAYMSAHGVPAVLIWPTAAWEIGGAIAIILGVWLLPIGVLAAGWCVVTGLIFHGAWADPNQQVQFLKNLVMAGGFLILARAGAPHLSLARVGHKSQGRAQALSVVGE